jgi:hypothetical protein
MRTQDKVTAWRCRDEDAFGGSDRTRTRDLLRGTVSLLQSTES